MRNEVTGKWDPLFIMVVSIPNPWTDPCKCAPAPACLTEGKSRLLSPVLAALPIPAALTPSELQAEGLQVIFVARLVLEETWFCALMSPWPYKRSCISVCDRPSARQAH